MKWHERIARDMGIKHGDTVAVVRWGKDAKRATRRRERRNATRERTVQKGHSKEHSTIEEGGL